MAQTRIRCPECDTVFRMRDPVPDGKSVRCPECDTRFRPPADDVDDAPVARKRDRDRRRDEDDYDDRPRRSRAGKKRPEKKGNGVLIAALAIAAVVVLGGAAVGAAIWWRAETAPPVVAKAPDGAAANKPAPPANVGGNAAPKAVAKAAPNARGEPTGRSGLEIGDTALEIEGEDIDGQTFKLSDYRGKVVVLDFWGHW